MVGLQGFRKCCKHGSHCVKNFVMHLVRIKEQVLELVLDDVVYLRFMRH